MQNPRGWLSVWSCDFKPNISLNQFAGAMWLADGKRLPLEAPGSFVCVFEVMYPMRWAVAKALRVTEGLF